MALLAQTGHAPKQTGGPTENLSEGWFNWLNNTVTEAKKGVLGTGGNLTSGLILFVNIATIIVFGLATIALAYAFVMYITSAGDPKAAQRASRALLWGVISLVVGMVAWGIKTIVFKLFNITGLY